MNKKRYEVSGWIDSKKCFYPCAQYATKQLAINFANGRKERLPTMKFRIVDQITQEVVYEC